MRFRIGALGCRRDLAWTLVIWGIGLGLRVACVLEFSEHPLGQAAWIDEQAYAGRALEIKGGNWLPTRPFYQDPLYPYLLAGLISVVGPELSSIRLGLACLGSLTPPLVFWAGRIGLGRAAGVVAGFFLALYGPAIFTDAALEKEGLGALIAALALVLTALATRRADRCGPILAMGAAWGALALLRANALIVGPIGVVWWFRAPRRWAGALAFASGFALVVAPATLINAIVADPPEFILTTWQGGANFYVGNGPEATGTYAEVPWAASHPFFEAEGFAAEARRRAGRPLALGEVSRFWFRAGLERWRTDPVGSLRLLARKVRLLGNDHEVADNHDFAFVRLVAAPALRWGFLSFGWLAPLAALGLGRSDHSSFRGFLVLSAVAGLASTALFFVLGRYRIPWVPGLALIAASGVVDASRRIASGRFRGSAVRVLVLMVPVAILAWAPSTVPLEDRWGLPLRRLFKAEIGAGRIGPAIDALDDARALGPGPAAALGAMLAAGPDHDAIAALIPSTKEATLDRIRLLRQVPEGRAEARRLLDDILRTAPDNRRARYESGAWWLGAVGDPDARRLAIEELSRAASGPSRAAEAAILLGLVTRNIGALDLPALRRDDAGATRIRIARAILAETRGGRRRS